MHITRRHFVSAVSATAVCSGCAYGAFRPAFAASDLSHLHICTEVVLADIALASGFAYAENPRNTPIDPRADNAEAASLYQKKWNPERRVLDVDFLSEPPYIDKVIQYARAWEDHMGLRFRFGRGEPELLVAFDAGGSWSFIGTDSIYYARNGRVSMNFGWFSANTDDSEFRRTVLHEFGHALSLVHEHQHPASSVSWNEEAVVDYYKRYGWNNTDVQRNIFSKYRFSQINGTGYDQESIMHYPIPVEFVKKKEDVVGWNTDLSRADKSLVGFLYPKQNGTRLP